MEMKCHWLHAQGRIVKRAEKIENIKLDQKVAIERNQNNLEVILKMLDIQRKPLKEKGMQGLLDYLVVININFRKTTPINGPYNNNPHQHPKAF